jgi:hypothetical protein
MKSNEERGHDLGFRTVSLGRYAVSTVNGILWDKIVTRKTEQDIYDTIIKMLHYKVQKYGILIIKTIRSG